MATIRVHKTKNYTVMSNTHLRDKKLSLKAKGLLSVMLSLPDNWDYSIAGLVAICKENETAVKSALNELKDNNYVVVTKENPTKSNGERIKYTYEVYEEPYKQKIEKYGLIPKHANYRLDNYPDRIYFYTKLQVNKLDLLCKDLSSNTGISDWLILKIDLKDRRSYIENDKSTMYRFFEDPKA